ncbi:tRNA (guanine(26)-N(2))-dimethyltransferase isoform X2 [Bacillus rossius redtenbacheri]|uniref:tRNA (guanine(26)-N(2))-dimethyltransferase isoform X2 n=1 Tax=Bacillus rossius redtenbacheri TaxID=93214 RepID=UPI002FDE7768
MLLGSLNERARSESSGLREILQEEFDSVAVLTHYAAEHHKRIMDSRKKTLMGDKLLTAGAKFEEGVTILEAFSATGLRSIRYAREVPGVKRVLANDISELAVKSITANIAHNQVQGLVSTSHNDAAMVMYEHRKQTERFHCVDLDPYGCPSAFLDGAVQCVRDEGVLLVTCTDMALLCGNTPETCHAKYGAISLKSKACHEMALRIVLQCIESHANRYGRYIVPLLSVSADFYVRVFVRVRTSAAACKQSVSKLGMVYQCVGCDVVNLQPLMTGGARGAESQAKLSLPHGPPVTQLCQHCSHRHHVGGPIWIGPLHDVEFAINVLKVVKLGAFATQPRMEGVLTVILEELPDVPLYYSLERLCAVVHCETMPMLAFRSALLNTGHRVSFSHACRQSIKTDAPAEVVWDVVRHWVRTHPVRSERLVGAAAAILGKKPATSIDMTTVPEANPPSRQLKLVRFQENPRRHWGPGTRSNTCVQGENKIEKSKRNQGKRKRKDVSKGSSPVQKTRCAQKEEEVVD